MYVCLKPVSVHVEIPEDIKYIRIAQAGQVGGYDPDRGGQGHCHRLIYNLNIISHPLSLGNSISDASCRLGTSKMTSSFCEMVQ